MTKKKNAMNKFSFILLISLFIGLLIPSPASAQDKTGENKDAKVVTDSNDLQWVEEVAQRALILSEEAARRAELRSREMERRMYHRMEDAGRRGQMRMEHRDTSRYKRYDFPGYLDSLEMPGMQDRGMMDLRDLKELQEMHNFPSIPYYPEKYGDFHNLPPLHGFMFSDSKSGSSWSYERRLNDATYSNEYSIATDGSAKRVDLFVSGICAKGSITITVTSPDGKKLSDILIDENGNMNWRKSFNIEETKWTKGNWTFKVTTKDATGTFNISLDSF
jgi:hypothetical protein